MQSTSKEAFEAEATLQRALAKKLGIKGKKRKAALPEEEAAAEELDDMFAGLLYSLLHWSSKQPSTDRHHTHSCHIPRLFSAEYSSEVQKVSRGLTKTI